MWQKRGNSIFHKGLYRCNLRIPNQEVITLYNLYICEWFKEKLGGVQQYNSFLRNLVSGDVDECIKELGDYLLLSAGSLDTGKKSERFYHGFVFGLVANLQDSHTVRSNRGNMGKVVIILC